jgi:hypothetical protein
MARSKFLFLLQQQKGKMEGNRKIGNLKTPKANRPGGNRAK